MSQTPLLSIVAAVYNGEKFLAQFFECIEQQQLDSYELILVNDGSTDNSPGGDRRMAGAAAERPVLEQENQGVSVARNTGLAAASGKYLAFPDIDDKLYPGMYRTLLEMAEKNISISPPATAPMCTKSAARATRSSHWIACPRRVCCRAMSGLSRPWTRGSFCTSPGLIFIVTTLSASITSISSTACAIRISHGPQKPCWPRSVQYTSQQFYDYYIHSESVSHKPDNDDTLMRSARHYMKILEMLEAINQRYPDKVRHIAACRWQIAKEGLGIIHTFDSMKDESKKHVIINEFFDRGIWRLIWKNACTFRLRWRLGRRYLRIKRYRHAG